MSGSINNPSPLIVDKLGLRLSESVNNQTGLAIFVLIK